MNQESKKIRVELTEEQKAALAEKLSSLENDIIREAGDAVYGGFTIAPEPYSKLHASGGYEKSF